MTAVMDEELQSSGGITIGGLSVGSQTLGIIIAVLGLIGSGLIFIQGINPLLESIGLAKTQIASKESAIRTKEQEVQSKKDVPQKIEEAKAKREAVLALLPSQENIDTLIIDINTRLQELGEPLIVSPVANISGSAFRSRLDDFSPSTVTEATPERPFKTREYRLTISATYQDTLEFMRKLERLRPLLVVKDINLKKSTVQIDAENLTAEQKNYVVATLPPLITTNFNLIAYIPLSPEELAQLQAAAAPAAGGAATPPK